jgi:uncharacterized protein (DUF302 family)
MRLLLAITLALFAATATAQSVAPRDGWVVIDTDHSFASLLENMQTAVADEGFGVVTMAGPTGAAASRGIIIPENRVLGVFNNLYAVRILGLSTAAMIEAPIRFYLTEDADGTATLSWKTPTFVFAPYFAEGGDDLIAAASELDIAFARIANAATR